MNIRSSLVTYILCALSTFSVNAFAHIQEVPQIQVTGFASTNIAPDIIHWQLNVNNHGYQLEEVAKKHQSIVSQLLATIKKQNIDKKTLQTTNMRFGEKTKYQQNNRVHDGYNASTQLSFTLLNIDEYQALWLKLASIKGVSISSVNYDSTKKTTLEKSTRLSALKNAKDKAIEMAGALAVNIGDPLVIKEKNSFNRQGVESFQRARLSDSNAVTPISIGLITIDIEVEVSFKLHSEITFKQ